MRRVERRSGDSSAGKGIVAAETLPVEAFRSTADPGGTGIAEAEVEVEALAYAFGTGMNTANFRSWIGLVPTGETSAFVSFALTSFASAGFPGGKRLRGTDVTMVSSYFRTRSMA